MRLRGLAVLLWNFLLYFFCFFLGMILARGSLYPISIVYFLVGCMCYFWSSNVLFGILPAAVAFPIAYGIFSSAVIADDTQGQASLTLWSSMRLMNREDIESLILAAIAATFGWLIMNLLLRRRKQWTQKARPYLFSLSACIVLVFLIISLIHS